ncbi:SMAD/FHA domain-containing protein [Umbelopsis sp. AD052]|nr:SMAD/FHA domain-containing protein [Umbelopsis sp. AD052]
MSEFAVPSAPTPKQPPQGPALAYNKPDWSSAAKLKYSFEILKNGAVVQEFVGPAREFITVGRLPLCDLELEHPSISRYHAVIQFNDDGKAFLYDLGSGHGTRINKKPVDKHSYVPLTEGDQIKFGESTRSCIFHTEFTEEEEEPEVTKKSAILIKRKQPMPVEDDEDREVTWYLRGHLGIKERDMRNINGISFQFLGVFQRMQ